MLKILLGPLNVSQSSWVRNSPYMDPTGVRCVAFDLTLHLRHRENLQDPSDLYTRDICIKLQIYQRAMR